MFKQFLGKAKEACFSILPVVLIIVLLFCISLIPDAFPTADNSKLIETEAFVTFIICAIFLILGFIFFDMGAEKALSKVGEYIGAHISEMGNIIIISIIVILLGCLIAIAEPDLSILSDQLSNSINPWVFKLIVGLGVGIFFLIALYRILSNKPSKIYFLFTYMLIFAIGCFFGPDANSSAFISLSFDTSGVSTGAATTPFIISFGASIAASKGGKDQQSNSFGFAGLMSAGPVITMLITCLYLKTDSSFILSNSQGDLESIGEILSGSLLEVLYGVLPILGFFIVYNILFLKLSKRELLKITFGFIYVYIGLYLFLASAKAGFIPLGYNLGGVLASNSNLYYLYILLSIIIGLSVVLAEPSIHVLNQQVEEISGGVVTKKAMFVALAIGVVASITLEVCRVVFWDYFSVWYYYVPLIVVILFVALFVDDIYVALAFDSGGVASGTLTVCFVLPFILGTIETLNSQNGTSYSGYGISGIVSLFPILSIEVMGLIAKGRSISLQRRARQRIYEEANDVQVIHF